MRTLSKRLHDSRRELDITITALAPRVGISHSYLSKIENDQTRNVPLELIEQLARELGVRPEYLVGWSEDPLGEDRPANVAEGRVVYEAASPGELRRIQNVMEIMHDLSPERQELAVRVLEEFLNAQRVRIVGE